MNELQGALEELNCIIVFCVLLSDVCPACQVLEEEEYEVWLKRQLLAESSIENREELLLESAQRLETNLTLLGTRDIQFKHPRFRAETRM